MEVTGYATIKKDAKTGIGSNPEKFFGQDVRVIEFSTDNEGVLVVASDGESMCMFDKEDVKRSFKCGVIGEIITPPDMDISEKMIYSMKVMNRKGGYNNLLRAMVIQASLMKGKFDDNILFAKERDDAAMEEYMKRQQNQQSQSTNPL